MAKILIVDDIVENIQILISIFEKNKPDFKLYQAPDGYIALVIAEKVLPDIIILDWDMPRMNGIEFLQEVKKNVKLKNIPVIMATGVMTSVENLQTALNAGAVDYIRKPFDEVEIVARTLSAMNLARQNKELLEKKNAELVENTLMMVRTTRFNQQLAKKIQEILDLLDSRSVKIKNKLQEVIDEINEKIKTDSWTKFEVAFNTINANFYQNLLSKYPNLTQAELKLSALLRLGLSTKDISAILFISPESVKVGRSRLRKKLKIDHSVNLQSFLAAF